MPLTPSNGERIPRASNSRLERLNRAGVNVGQCVSPARFSTGNPPGGAGETHCPTLRFMGRVAERRVRGLPANPLIILGKWY